MPTRLAFHQALRSLEDDVLELGRTVEQALEGAVQAAAAGDADAAQEIRDGDLSVNERFAGIERQAVSLIATQQPAARDLREILAILGIAVDLERIGDHAKGIAAECVRTGEPLPSAAAPDIQALLDLVTAMLRRSLGSLTDRDVAAARSLGESDAEVDVLFRSIREALLARMAGRPEEVRELGSAEWCAKSLERVADHATNIGERVVFLCTGEVIELNA